ncbi:MAG: ribonuclease P protein subunit [Nanoarchaeota archaeon]
MKLSGKKELYVNLTCKSLIGSKVEVVNSSNKNLMGISGELVFESANLFHIRSKNGLKKVLKSAVVLRVENNSEKFEIDGKILVGSLVTRIKKLKV